MNAAVPEPSNSELVRLRFERVLALCGVSSVKSLNFNVFNFFYFNNYDSIPELWKIESRSQQYDMEHSEFEETISLSRMKSLNIALAWPMAWLGSEGV